MMPVKCFLALKVKLLIQNTGSHIKDQVLDDFCWMYATFQVPPDFDGPCSGKNGHNSTGIYDFKTLNEFCVPGWLSYKFFSFE